MNKFLMAANNNKQLMAAMKQLTAALSKCNVAAAPANQPGNSRRRKRRNRRRRAGASLGAPARMNGAGSGDLIITKSELVATIELAANAGSAHGKIAIHTEGDLPWLKIMAASFERSQWRSLRAIYRPGCAMTQAGRFAMGFDWDWSGEADTRQKISAYQPNCGCAVYENCSIVIPVSRGPLRWFAAKATDKVNKGPGEVVWAVDAASSTPLVTGEVWLEYTVILSGPKA